MQAASPEPGGRDVDADHIVSRFAVGPDPLPDVVEEQAVVMSPVGAADR